LYIDKSLKDVVKNKKGNVAELNLLLVGMLNQAGLESDPVILSTRSHGKTNNLYPIMSKFNYVIARVGIGDAEYYLDASEPKLGFGKLPVRCYNGYARVINPATYQIDINSNNLMEAANTFAIIVKDESGKLQGSLRYQPGYYESLNARSKVKEKGMDEFKKDFSKNFTDFEVSEIVVDSLDAYENRLDLKATFSSDGFDEDVVYFQPLMINMFKDNPFKSENRNYPIEIPFAIDQAYQLQMDVPDGFKVDEIPQSIVLKLNEAGEGFFEYRISHSNNKITFRSRIVLARAIYQPEEYPMLREFFNQVVKKQSEQIVFKKLN
jgi:hypothetical protein